MSAAFPSGDLVEGGDLTACDFFAVSSGSTGEPTLWPRGLHHELPIAVRFEQVFRDSFRAHKRKTLAVVCFALGSWVGGMYTTSCLRWLAAKGYPLLIVTPGNKMDEILRVVRRLAPDFEQTVLLGYPPFLKEVVDAGRAEQLDWRAFNVRLVTAGEVFQRSLARLGAGAAGPERDPEQHRLALWHGGCGRAGKRDAAVGRDPPLPERAPRTGEKLVRRGALADAYASTTRPRAISRRWRAARSPSAATMARR